MRELHQGQVFAARYRIEELIGQGGVGAVYAATRMATDLKVAVKILPKEVLDSERGLKRFRLEARIAGRVDNEHLVKVFDAGRDEETGLPYLVMEKLKGRTLQQIVDQKGPLSTTDVADYLQQVANGLDAAHGYIDATDKPTPIVHRDIKPQNLFLADVGAAVPMVKILDFGIARIVGETLGQTEKPIGTPYFMAYEQATGQKVDVQSDIWSLGLTAFYLLTARHYWRNASSDEATAVAVLNEIVNNDLLSPSQRAVELGSTFEIPIRFDDWFARCVNREPSKRFSTAGQAAEQLRIALGCAETSDISGTSNTKPVPAYIPSITSQRKKSAIIVLLSVIVMVVGYMLLSLESDSVISDITSSAQSIQKASLPEKSTSRSLDAIKATLPTQPPEALENDSIPERIREDDKNPLTSLVPKSSVPKKPRNNGQLSRKSREVESQTKPHTQKGKQEELLHRIKTRGIYELR